MNRKFESENKIEIAPRMRTVATAGLGLLLVGTIKSGADTMKSRNVSLTAPRVEKLIELRDTCEASVYSTEYKGMVDVVIRQVDAGVEIKTDHTQIVNFIGSPITLVSDIDGDGHADSVLKGNEAYDLQLYKPGGLSNVRYPLEYEESTNVAMAAVNQGLCKS